MTRSAHTSCACWPLPAWTSACCTGHRSRRSPVATRWRWKPSRSCARRCRRCLRRRAGSRSQSRAGSEPRAAWRGMTALPARPFSAGDFPELDVMRALIQRAQGFARVETLCEVVVAEERLPVLSIEFGSQAPDAPAVGFFGGVHGVERIGTQVVLAYLHSLIERLHWDDSLPPLLERVRLVFMPLVNPGGMLARTRSNPA